MGTAPPNPAAPPRAADPDDAPEPRPWLPNLLREMAEDFDLATALRFAAAYGGRYLHLPAKPRADHSVARAFGEPVLAWLIARYGEVERIVVPMGPSAADSRLAATIRRLVAEGRTANDIAGRVGLHVRTVHAWKRRLAADEAARRGAPRKETSP